MNRLRILRYIQSIYAFMGAACALAAAVIALTAGLEAQKQDAASLKSQIAIARYETGDVYLSITGKLLADANSDATYDNVVRSWNEGWIVGEHDFTYTRESVHATAIVGPDGAIRFLDRRSEKNIGKLALSSAAGWSSLIGATRRGGANGISKEARGVIVVSGKPYFAAAAAITPTDVGNAPIASDLHYTLVFLKPATADYYYALAAGFGAQNVHLSHQNDAKESGEVSIPLLDAVGVARIWLHWQPHKPGSGFLGTLLPVLFVMLLVLAAMMAVGITRWNRAQKKYHEAKSRAVAAQEESRLKTVFLGNISHELRTPLNAILGFSELLTMQIFGPLGSQKYGEYAEAIYMSGQSMLRMVNDLIEIARIRAGDTAKERDTFDAAICLNQALEEAHPVAAKKDVRLSVQSGMAGAWCVGSELSLKAGLVRLIDNAVSATQGGQSVDITLERSATAIVIGILDRGAPASAERVKQMNEGSCLFAGDHLEAHESSACINYEIASGLIRLMGGSMHIEGLPDAGNRITVRIPSAAPHSKKLGIGADKASSKTAMQRP